MLHALLDSIPDIIFFKDIHGVYLGCNPPFAEFVGRPRAELIGKTDYDLFPRDVADFFKENDQRMLELQEPRHNEEWITYPDGRKILIDTLKTPYWGPDGTLIGVLGISRDITERKRAEEALRDSEVNFRTFFETIDDLIVVATREGRILFVNKALERKLGYTAAELAAMGVLELHPSDARKEAEEIFAAMFRGERESCPLSLAAKNGTLLPVETRVWFGKWNGADCLFGISKDLSTEREATQRFERLFRNNPSLMALSTLPERRFLDVNQAFLETLGYAWSEVIGKTAAELNLFANPAQHTTEGAELLAAGRIANVEMKVRRKDGGLLDGLFSGELIHNQGRLYLLTVMADVSEQKKTARELERISSIQRELMHLATDFVNVPMERQDAAIDQSLAIMGRLIHADRAYLFDYDFAKETMSNTHEWCADGVNPEIGNLQAVPMSLLPDWVTPHQRGNPVHIPCVAALPETGTLRQILEPQGIRSLITLPLINDSACLGFVGFDAVREERVWGDEEIALLRVLAELYAHFKARLTQDRNTRELQKNLVHARDAAQEAARAKSLFLANMSHEIRTPLNAILGYAQIMERECQACPTGQRLNAITRNGEHLLELITDLLELARSDARTITLSPGEFDFAQVLEDVRLMFARRPEAQGVALEIVMAPPVPPFLYADKGKIRQILINLVGNAFKFTRKGGVRLSASLAEGAPADPLMIAVEVEDTGSGIAPEDLDRIFDLFEQAENGRKTGKGTGLGLPLSLRYARALGGDITVTSQPGSGSRFRFTFTARALANPGGPGSVKAPPRPSPAEHAPADGLPLPGLPPEERRLLDMALRQGDVRQLRAIADTLTRSQPALGAALRTLIEGYDYDGLRRLLDAIKREIP
jgi:PAS domain S-box-containing protein